MNQSKWNAYRIALIVEKHFSDGIPDFKLRQLIERGCGTDPRTIKKYMKILRVNKYIIRPKDDYSKWKANPDIKDMKPKSLKQLLEEWED